MLLPIACLAGCRSGKVVKTEFYPMKKLLVEENFAASNVKTASAEILDVSVKDSILIINVKYYAGENLNDFDLVTDGKMIKTLPPIVSLYLRNNTPGANEKKLVFQELQFNMSPAKQWSADQVVFHLAGYTGDIHLKF
jgi:hypothetical protein